MTVQVMLPVSPETKEMAYYLKGPGRSYDKFLNELLSATLKEKMNESPASCSCKSTEPGEIHRCNCKTGVTV